MSISVGYTIFYTIASLIIIGFIILILAIYFYKEEDKEIKNIIWNFDAQNNNGFSTGIEKDSFKHISGRTKTVMIPKDINRKLFKKLKKIDDVEVISDRGCRILIPKGDLSNNNNIIVLLPGRAEDLPKTLRETSFGKLMMLGIEIEKSVEDEIDAIREGSNRKSSLLNKMGDGELSKEHLERISEIIKDIYNLAKQERKAESKVGHINIPPNKIE